MNTATAIAPAPAVPLLLDKGQVCALLNCSPRTLDYWIAGKSFPRAIKPGNARMSRWKRSDVEAWIEAQPYSEPQASPNPSASNSQSAAA